MMPDRFTGLLCTTESELFVESLGIAGCDNDGAIQEMLAGTINQAFKVKGDQSVHRIGSVQGTFFLKRTRREPPRHVLRHLLRGRRAYTNSGWVYQAIRALQAEGIKVMAPIARAEERWFGIWPRRGFLLVSQVKGAELVDLINTPSTPSLRGRAYRAFGQFLGRLHGSGFIHAARPRDFIADDGVDIEASGDASLTMIDVDFHSHRAVRQPFDPDEALRALAHVFYLIFRAGHPLNHSDAVWIIKGYGAGLRAREQSLEKGWVRRVAELIDLELARHHHNSDLAARFQGLPPTLMDGIRGAQ